MSISSEITNLAENRDAIKAAIIGKRPAILPGNGLSSFPASIASIPTGEDDEPWVKPETWPDIKAILAADTHDYPYKRIELLNDQQLATYLTGGVAFYTSEGNFYSSPTTFTWDSSKDIVASDGSRYRWVISFSTNGNFNNGCGMEKNLLWYVLSTGAYASHTFNTRFLCQKLEGTFTHSGTSIFSSMSSLVEIEGSVTSTATNLGGYFSYCWNLRKLPSNMSFNSATACNSMFQECHSLRHLPSGFSVPNTQSIASMFAGCWALEDLPEDLAFKYCTNASFAFQNCYALESIPDSMELADGSNMYGTFMECHSLKTVPSKLAASIGKATNLLSLFQNSGIRSLPPISSSTVTNIAGLIRNIGLGADIPKLDFGTSPITSYGDFSHSASSFPDVLIATNMTGTAPFPSGYLYTDKIPSKLRVNVPVNLPITRAGSGQKDRLATFDQSGNVNGGLIYNVYDLTSDPSYVSGTYKEFRLQVSVDLKNSFTQEQKDAISSFLGSKGWTLAW